jgi:hypothetical protein
VRALRPGERVEVLEQATLACGAVRLRCAHGWVSPRRASDGAALLQRTKGVVANGAAAAQLLISTDTANSDPGPECGGGDAEGAEETDGLVSSCGVYKVLLPGLVRTRADLASPRLETLRPGERVTVKQQQVLPCGAVRLRCERGWTSLRRAADGAPLLQRCKLAERRKLDALAAAAAAAAAVAAVAQDAAPPALAAAPQPDGPAVAAQPITPRKAGLWPNDFVDSTPPLSPTTEPPQHEATVTFGPGALGLGLAPSSDAHLTTCIARCRPPPPPAPRRARP